MKRIVVDTNALVSALLFGGKAGKLVTLWKQGRIVPLCSREIVEEYLRVLAYPKFQLVKNEIDFLLTHEILPYFKVLIVKQGEPVVVKDPSDDKFIWCALEGHAEVIVSGDKHLLNLSQSPVPIITVAAFIESEK
jgi:putative PIN family toxin of toxin-antitoxin system